MRRIISLIFALSFLEMPAAVADAPVDAVWKPQQVEFTYIGVTTHYTCHGLKTRTAKLMRHLGAKDISVEVGPCFDGTRIQSMFKVSIDYKTLVTSPPDNTDTVSAIEQQIIIDGNDLGRHQTSHCELVERFVKYALPKTNYQVISDDIRCNANRSGLTGELRLNALVPADQT